MSGSGDTATDPIRVKTLREAFEIIDTLPLEVHAYLIPADLPAGVRITLPFGGWWMAIEVGEIMWPHWYILKRAS